MKEKTKGLLVNLLIYLLAFGVGLIPFIFTENIFLAEAYFTLSATFVIYVITFFYPDTSIYDPYWSVAPPVMLLIAMIKYGYWSMNAILLFAGVCIWALRLTINWAITYKGLGHEDWRYANFRKKHNKFVFEIINFFGLQYVPTIVVYAGLVGAFFVLESTEFAPLMLIGIAIMILGSALEYFADTAIHAFLRENKGSMRTCDVAIWKYSRHPNYLGEMTFWVGVFVAFLAVRPDIWYYGLGFLLIELLFMTVSIPMMEKHNLERRPDYVEYKEKTSMLIPLPPKK
ncbi:MAG: DUF1295 domain-containing protein [Clostridia bacterium]|nr:DUF1295 domain-containing protein [Clostridia bacterium]